MKSCAPVTIAALAKTHPQIFRGNYPRVSPTIPTGWLGLIDEFCLLLEAVCDQHELAALEFASIVNDSGCLIFNFTFGCSLSERQTQTIDARVFALRNRSIFSCIVCGNLSNTLTNPVLCESHNKIT